MNLQELSTEFDIEYNNIMSNQAPGLSEYEKSVLLTKSKESIILEIYNGQESFDSSERMKVYIRNLIKDVTNESVTSDGDYIPMGNNSYVYKIPEDVLFTTYEEVLLDSGICQNTKAIVIPITQDTYYRIINNPFRNPNYRRVLKLTLNNNLVELISKYPIESYHIRYIKRPKPIILEDLEDGLSINGETEKTTDIEIDEILHRTLIDRAVKFAKLLFISNTQQDNNN